MARQSLIHYAAHCHTCGKSCEARNAQGWAHQHVNRNPGHEVELALGYFISSENYNAPTQTVQKEIH